MHRPESAAIWRLLRIAPGPTAGASTMESVQSPSGSAPDDLLTVVRGLADAGFTHLLTEPASGQSDPIHTSAMLTSAAAFPDAVVIGCGCDEGGRTASIERLCLRLETGLHIAEPNSPYGIYPLPPLRRLACMKDEGVGRVELLTHLVWGGVPVHTVPLPGRVASGNRAGGRLRAFLCHARLLLRRLAPWPHPQLVDRRPPGKPMDLWHPIRLLREMFAEHASPRDLAIAGFVGVFMGALPLLACHTLAILYVTTRYRLNRAMAVATQNICAPPVVPVLCVEVGYFLRHGSWLTEVSRQTLLLEMHQRLFEWFIGSLIVGPVLGFITAFAVFFAARGVARRALKDGKRTRINNRRRGNRLGFLSFTVALRLFGRRGAYGLLYMVASYYVLFDPVARHLALPYLRRRFPLHNGWRRIADYYRLFYSQGVSLIDRYRMMIAPQAFRQSVSRYEQVKTLAEDRSRGFVLLVSHVGNWQAMMLALKRMNRDITLLMRPEENPITQEYLAIQGGSQALRMVSPDMPMGGVIELTQRFGQGDIIAIMGDRAYDAATLPLDFMGAVARFPCGPFQLAAAWECPVVVLFAAKTGVDEYTVDIADIIRVDRAGDRRENLKRAMQTYANCLQEFAEKHPYQVYLFEDVWRTGEFRSPGLRQSTRAEN